MNPAELAFIVGLALELICGGVISVAIFATGGQFRPIGK